MCYEQIYIIATIKKWSTQLPIIIGILEFQKMWQLVQESINTLILYLFVKSACSQLDLWRFGVCSVYVRACFRVILRPSDFAKTNLSHYHREYKIFWYTYYDRTVCEVPDQSPSLKSQGHSCPVCHRPCPVCMLCLY